MKINHKIIAIIVLTVSATTLLFSLASYHEQREAFLRGVDRRLFMAAMFLKVVLPSDYHDRLRRDSFAPEEYDKVIVDQNNKLCLDLGLQYLWSVMIVDGKVVFTTSTSPSKKVEKQDHAKFFEGHRDPRAFDEVFKTMKPSYSSFHNEWGHGRMALIPFIDRQGRPYCFGASVNINWIKASMQQTMINFLIYSLIALLIGVVASIVVANYFTKSIVRLQTQVEFIGSGNLDYQVDARAKDEIGMLAKAFNAMRIKLRDSYRELEGKVQERTRELKNALVTTEEQNKRLEDSRKAMSDLVRDLEKAKMELEAEKKVLQETQMDLKRSNADLEQFAYVASHDLQEPLRMVSSYVQLLEKRYRGKLDANADEFIRFAAEGAKRMEDLINDLMVYSRVGTQPRGELEWVNVGKAVDSAVANLEITILEQGATVSYDPLPDVLADPIQLTQLFQNLIANAIKFRREELPKIHISSKRDKDEWVFSVHDNGMGIDKDYADKIFVIFQRLHEHGTYPGTGIGLAICKKIAERHRGRIWVESEAGKGSTFYFTLPILG